MNKHMRLFPLKASTAIALVCFTLGSGFVGEGLASERASLLDGINDGDGYGAAAAGPSTPMGFRERDGDSLTIPQRLDFSTPRPDRSSHIIITQIEADEAFKKIVTALALLNPQKKLSLQNKLEQKFAAFEGEIIKSIDTNRAIIQQYLVSLRKYSETQETHIAKLTEEYETALRDLETLRAQLAQEVLAEPIIEKDLEASHPTPKKAHYSRNTLLLCSTLCGLVGAGAGFAGAYFGTKTS